MVIVVIVEHVGNTPSEVADRLLDSCVLSKHTIIHRRTRRSVDFPSLVVRWLVEMRPILASGRDQAKYHRENQEDKQEKDGQCSQYQVSTGHGARVIARLLLERCPFLLFLLPLLQGL